MDTFIKGTAFTANLGQMLLNATTAAGVSLRGASDILAVVALMSALNADCKAAAVDAVEHPTETLNRDVPLRQPGVLFHVQRRNNAHTLVQLNPSQWLRVLAVHQMQVRPPAHSASAGHGGVSTCKRVMHRDAPWQVQFVVCDSSRT